MYHGVQHPSSTVALFYDPTEKSFTLDKLDAEFRFTLRSTPGQKDVRDTDPEPDDGVGGNGDQEGDVLFGEDSDDEDATPDANNPYDYRHFLNNNNNNNNNKGNRSPSPVPSYATSPIPQQHTFHSSPALPATSIRLSQKSKPPSPSRPPKPNPHSQKQKAPRYLSPKPHQRAVPNAASEEEDSDELVIDMGDSPGPPRPTTDRPWRSALGVLNEGGPVSLRSAASSMSPSLRGASPSEDDYEEEEEEEGESDANANAEGGVDDDDGDVDVDVEEMDLRRGGDDDVNETVNNAPPPAAAAEQPIVEEEEQAATPEAGRGDDNNGWDDDDDDELEAELALALEEDQAKSDVEVELEEARRVGGEGNGDGDGSGSGMNGGIRGGGGVESSEESEEE